MDRPAPIAIDDRTYVLVLTGAGVSAESGVPTFRGMGGLWENHPVERVASPQGFADDPALVWRFYSQRRQAAAGVQPNDGHRALAALEQRLGDRFLLATQNVDGLHTRAGSQRVVELHGNLFRSRCSRCDRDPIDDAAVYGPNELPACSQCEQRGEFALLRPDIVWFGEALAPRDLARVEALMNAARGQRFVFIAAGTSGNVFPAAGFVKHAQRVGAETWLVNLEPAENGGSFDHVVQGRSGELLPALFGSVV